MADINWICSEINYLDADQLRQIAKHLNRCMDDLARKATHKLRVGSKVSWKSKDGLVIKGTVTRVMPKNVLVVADGPLNLHWKVTASLLQVES